MGMFQINCLEPLKGYVDNIIDIGFPPIIAWGYKRTLGYGRTYIFNIDILTNNGVEL